MAETTITATIEKVIHQKVTSGWGILSLRSEKPFEKTGSKIAKAVGVMAHPIEGQEVTLNGVWETNPRFGVQFKFSSFERKKITSKGLERWLSENTKGVGPIKAKMLAKKYDDIEKIAQADRDDLISCVGQRSYSGLMRSLQSYRQNVDNESLKIDLMNAGLTPWQSGKVIDKWQSDAIKVVNENPYEMTQIHGIGFNLADKVAIGMGVAPDSPNRIYAGIIHTMHDLAKQRGHTLVPDGFLVQHAGRTINLAAEKILPQFNRLEREEAIKRVRIDDKSMVALPEYYDAESQIASHVARMLENPNPLTESHVSEITRDVELTPMQEKGLYAALRHRLVIITGGPGVGKTFLVRKILEAMTYLQLEVMMCSPTGKAAKRMMDATGHLAETVHRMLKYNPFYGKFTHDEDNPVDADVVICDEVSMVDVKMQASIMRALPRKCRLILVGDADQLPSVGPGAVLRDFIRCDMIPVIRLNQIMRQAEGSSIISGSHMVNNGKMPFFDKKPPGDLFHFPIKKSDSGEKTKEMIIDMVVDVVSNRIPSTFQKPDGNDYDPIWDIQCLAPKKVMVEAINEALAPVLNPMRSKKARIDKGDRIMNITNNYRPALISDFVKDPAGYFVPESCSIDDDGNLEGGHGDPLFNGYIGIVTDSITVKIGEDPKTKGAILRKYLVADMEGMMHVFHPQDRRMVLSYCSTIHKAQGSESPAIILILDQSSWIMLKRNLIYTGMTRASHLCVIVGQKQAITQSIRCEEANRRMTMLSKMLQRENLTEMRQVTVTVTD